MTARRVRALVAVLAIVGGLGWIALRGLGGNLVYYVTPGELSARGAAAVGEQVRLGGQVVPGSVHSVGDGTDFVVSDGASRIAVRGTRALPALFREGQGVVLEGALGADRVFRAQTVLVKHSSDYEPPAPGEVPAR